MPLTRMATTQMVERLLRVDLQSAATVAAATVAAATVAAGEDSIILSSRHA